MAHKNGCHNRLPLGSRTYPVQDGWSYDVTFGATESRLPVIRQQDHVMSTDCQYSQLTTNDPGCNGCIRKWTPPAPAPDAALIL